MAETETKSGTLVFAVNGERFELPTIDPSTTLLEFLRSQTRFKSAKLSCGEGCSVSLFLSLTVVYVCVSYSRYFWELSRRYAGLQPWLLFLWCLGGYLLDFKLSCLPMIGVVAICFSMLCNLIVLLLEYWEFETFEDFVFCVFVFWFSFSLRSLFGSNHGPHGSTSYWRVWTVLILVMWTKPVFYSEPYVLVSTHYIDTC